MHFELADETARRANVTLSHAMLLAQAEYVDAMKYDEIVEVG